MQVPNINTISTVFDRLSVENIKLVQFERQNQVDRIQDQKLIILEVMKLISKYFTTYCDIEEKDADLISQHLNNKAYFQSHAIMINCDAEILLSNIKSKGGKKYEYFIEKRTFN